MMRPSVIIAAVSMLAACGGLAYLHSTRQQSTDEIATVKPATSASVASQSREASHDATANAETALSSAENTETTSPSSANTSEAASPQTAPAANTPEGVAQLIQDTQSADAPTRAAAIAALVDAPKAQAIPALKRVIESGEPTVDRQIALRSLHSMALRDGDENGAIRDAIRHAIYHGDDDNATQTAQSLLEDIEAEFASRQPAN